jgi:hypothetical protein
MLILTACPEYYCNPAKETLEEGNKLRKIYDDSQSDATIAEFIRVNTLETRRRYVQEHTTNPSMFPSTD